jgi:hypothetical protein
LLGRIKAHRAIESGRDIYMKSPNMLCISRRTIYYLPQYSLQLLITRTGALVIMTSTTTSGMLTAELGHIMQQSGNKDHSVKVMQI